MPSARISGNFPHISQDARTFLVQTFSLEGYGAAREDGDDVPLRHEQNSHACGGGGVLKHWRTTRCFKNKEMRIRRRDMEVASQCS